MCHHKDDPLVVTFAVAIPGAILLEMFAWKIVATLEVLLIGDIAMDAHSVFPVSVDNVDVLKRVFVVGS